MNIKNTRKIRFVLLMAASLILLLSVTACGGSSGSKAKFTYYLDSTVQSLDPQTADGESAAMILNAVFEGLCRVDEDNNPVPGAAKAWFSNPDHTKYVFLLRDDAKWSNGEPVTAHDFVFAMKRALDPATMAANVDDLFVIKNAREIYSGTMEVSELGITANSDYILTVDLAQSDANFPASTASIRFMPCNEAFFISTSGRYGLEDQYLITNGPFAFDYWDTEKSVSLYRSPNWQDKKTPAALTFYMSLKDEIAADPAAALASGSADILKLNEAQAAGASALGCGVKSFTAGVTGLIFNTDEQYLSCSALRELFVKSIDRQALLDNLPTSESPANDIIPNSILWGSMPYREYAEKELYVKQDPSAVQNTQAIINEMKLETIPSVTVMCRNDPLSLEIANRVIASWNKAIGSYFNILPLDDAAYEQKFYARDYQIALCTVKSTGNTPYSFLKHFESTASPLLLNSKDYDTLLHSVDKTVTDYAGLEKFLHNQYIFYPVLTEQTYYGISPKVKNLIVEIGRIDFIYAEK